MFSSLPRADGGRAEEGHYESEEQKTVTAAASPERTAASSAPLGGLACLCLVPGPGGLAAGSRARGLAHSPQ